MGLSHALPEEGFLHRCSGGPGTGSTSLAAHQGAPGRSHRQPCGKSKPSPLARLLLASAGDSPRPLLFFPGGVKPHCALCFLNV